MSKGTNRKIYSLPSVFRKNKLLKEISSKHLSEIKQPTLSIQTFYDTFDGRLYKKHYMLIFENDSFYLKSIPTETQLAQIKVDLNSPKRFWWDFPECKLKNILKKLLDVRALLPLAQIRINSQTIHILNSDSKTVLLTAFEEKSTQDNNRSLCLKLQPVKGYKREFDNFVRFLDTFDLTTERMNTFELAYKTNNSQPGKYSSKPKVQLLPDLPAHIAMKNIFSFLLKAVQSNEAGIIEDYDTEFLHDFRVSIRRTRSALTQIKRIFPPEITGRYKKDFSKIAKSTNRMRDLDVYLLKRDSFLNMLPLELAFDLEPMFKVLRERRITEHQKVVKTLNTFWYKNTLQSWQTFLKQTELIADENTEHAETPIIELAKKSIWKKYRKILNSGLAITQVSPDEDLHKLRIECKKLRYLLEFFTSLFPKKEMKILLKQLQNLQENLGDFNDLYIQQMSLQSFVSDELKNNKYQKTKIAIGGLIALLNQRRQEVRLHFEETFAHFSSASNFQLFRKLFR